MNWQQPSQFHVIHNNKKNNNNNNDNKNKKKEKMDHSLTTDIKWHQF